MRAIVFALPLLFATGCSIAPSLPSERRISITEVVDAVQCELAEAVKPYLNHPEHGWLKNWAAGYILTLKVEDEASVVASSDFIDILSAGTLTVSANGGAAHFGNRTASIEFSLFLADLDGYVCTRPEPRSRYFTGGTGLAEWMDRVVAARGADDRIQPPTKFGHSLDFAVKLNAGGGPAWVFATYRPKAGLSASRKNTHTLAITFTERAKAPDRFGTKVQITNWHEMPSHSHRPREYYYDDGGARTEEPPQPPKKQPETPRKKFAPRGFTPVDPATQDKLDRDLDRLERRSQPDLQELLP